MAARAALPAFAAATVPRCHLPRPRVLGFCMPRGRKPDPKQREQILQLRAAGLSLAQIGKRLISPSTARAAYPAMPHSGNVSRRGDRGPHTPHGRRAGIADRSKQHA
jgi:hypothetical protein